MEIFCLFENFHRWLNFSTIPVCFSKGGHSKPQGLGSGQCCAVQLSDQDVQRHRHRAVRRTRSLRVWIVPGGGRLGQLWMSAHRAEAKSTFRTTASRENVRGE